MTYGDASGELVDCGFRAGANTVTDHIWVLYTAISQPQTGITLTPTLHGKVDPESRAHLVTS